MIKKNELEWETTYKDSHGRHKNIYPSELVISFVKRNYNTIRLNKGDIKCLDLGCGWGNNLYFLKKEGFDCYGIDLSKTAISHLKPDFSNKVYCGSALLLPHDDNFFNFIVDRASIQHNTRKDISLILQEVYRTLIPGGKFFSIMVKEGENGFLVTKLSESELKKELSRFNSYEINYSSHTKSHGSELSMAYVIEAEK